MNMNCNSTCAAIFLPEWLRLPCRWNAHQFVGRCRPDSSTAALESGRHRRKRARDHTPVAAGESRVFGEQLGPTRASRAMAIVHIAVFDALNAIDGRYDSYSGLPPAPDGTSSGRHDHLGRPTDTLVALFPSQAPIMDGYLEGGPGMRSHPGSPRHGGSAARASGLPPPRSSRLGDDGSAIRRAPSRHRVHPRGRAGAIAPGTRSAEVRSRWERTGARCVPFVLRSVERVPGPAAARQPRARGLRRGFRRDEDPGGRRHRPAVHFGTPRGDVHRHLLGLRWHAKSVRAAPSVQPGRGSDRRPDAA